MAGRYVLTWARAAFDNAYDVLTDEERTALKIMKAMPVDFAEHGRIYPEDYNKATCAALHIIKARGQVV